VALRVEPQQSLWRHAVGAVSCDWTRGSDKDFTRAAGERTSRDY
jgi:hypothetical protein